MSWEFLFRLFLYRQQSTRACQILLLVHQISLGNFGWLGQCHLFAMFSPSYENGAPVSTKYGPFQHIGNDNTFWGYSQHLQPYLYEWYIVRKNDKVQPVFQTQILLYILFSCLIMLYLLNFLGPTKLSHAVREFESHFSFFSWSQKIPTRNLQFDSLTYL